MASLIVNISIEKSYLHITFNVFSSRPCGIQNTKSVKNRFARRFTKSSVPPEPRDCASPPQGRSAPLNMPTNAPPSTRTSASRSTGQNMNPTPNLSAPLSTSRIASLNGGVMATTRCGLRLRELARMFPTTSARRSPRPTPSRLLTRSARTFPSRSAFLFLARSASPSPTRFAPASLSQNVRTFLASNATLSTKGSPSESADRSQRRFATRLQSMHRSLSLSTTSSHQSRICSAMAFLPFPPRLRPRSSLQETSKSSRMPPMTIGLFSHKSRSNSRNFSCNGVFIKKALANGVEKKKLIQVKGVGASGSFKLAKVELGPKKKAAKPKSSTKKAKTPSKPKKKAVKSKPAAKKATPKKKAEKSKSAKKAAKPKKPVAKKAAKPSAKKPAKKAAPKKK